MVDNTDDLIAQMEQDERSDAEYLKPRQFAKLMGMEPQLVYYYIRAGVITKEVCLCGGPIVHVERSKKALQAHKEGQPGGVRREPDEEVE